MINNYMKKFIIEMNINKYLNELKEYGKDIYNYLNGYNNIDKEDLIVDIEDFEYTVDKIDQLIYDLENEYEMNGGKNE